MTSVKTVTQKRPFQVLDLSAMRAIKGGARPPGGGTPPNPDPPVGLDLL